MADPNLKAAQRLDSSILELIRSASNATVYPYDAKNDSWLEPEFRGPICLCSTNQANSYRLVVLNHLDDSNWLLQIDEDAEVQPELDAKFLIIRDADDETFGLWFQDDRECHQLTTAITSLIDQLKKSSEALKPTKSFGGDQSVSIHPRPHSAAASPRVSARGKPKATASPTPSRGRGQGKRMDPMGEALRGLAADQLRRDPNGQVLTQEQFGMVLEKLLKGPLQKRLYQQYQSCFQLAQKDT
eukprot:TRINITY_DN7957_c0_g1_i1.p1 TRINITY_DN7957_c0_g1~~TRINITY_DN7957_c0_g1_i1.p1  ORF type:complete len:243 (+),score=33.23 TRINITY_DN7957_c0_g1_i1:231-959(+)